MTGNQRQNQNNGNQSRRNVYRKSRECENHNSSNSESNSNNNKPKIREYKFYLHDAAQRKTSKSFNKINEAIIQTIQKMINETREVTKGIKKKFQKIISRTRTRSPSKHRDPQGKATCRSTWLCKVEGEI